MKIIEPSVELIDDVNAADVYSKIERCGRVCHKSEPKGDAADFIRKLIRLGHESVLEHVSLTFHIICDRAITAELTRHRLASFSVESTRYVAYKELSFVTPNMEDDALELIEAEYRERLLHGESPEIAREMLPLCTKTELYMTANLREWRHILKLRTAPAAHPQMRVVANQILGIFRKKLPVIVEDIGGKQHEDND